MRKFHARGELALIALIIAAAAFNAARACWSWCGA